MTLYEINQAIHCIRKLLDVLEQQIKETKKMIEKVNVILMENADTDFYCGNIACKERINDERN